MALLSLMLPTAHSSSAAATPKSRAVRISIILSLAALWMAVAIFGLWHKEALVEPLPETAVSSLVSAEAGVGKAVAPSAEAWGASAGLREAPPKPLQLAASAVLAEDRVDTLVEAEGKILIERVALWTVPATGERWRSVQWFASDDAVREEWALVSEAVMAADYFLLSPKSEATGWGPLDEVELDDQWNLSLAYPRSHVARIDAPVLTASALEGLEAIFADLAGRLEADFSVGWSYLFEPVSVPNDPHYPGQWALSLMNAPLAWTRTTGSADTVIAVIDTGVDYRHPDLLPNMWVNPNEIEDGTDTNGNGFIDDIRGWDFASGTNNPMDASGHGTGVASVIGAVGNNAFGIAGVSWSARIMPLAVGAASIPMERIIDAIDYAIWQRSQAGENVVAINISLGTRLAGVARDAETPLFLAVRRARGAGILCVFAAGNDSRNNDTLYEGEPNHFFPSDLDLENVLSVANTTSSDVLYSASNYGPISVDMAAPGHIIRTAWPGGGFIDQSGTSFAAPHVAGAIALVYAFNPHLQPQDVRSIVIRGSQPLASLEGKLANPVRLSLGGVLNEAARWPRVRPATAWSGFPILRSLDPEPLFAGIEVERDSVESVTFYLAGEPLEAVGADNSQWGVHWQPPGESSYSWRVHVVNESGREVDATLPEVTVLHPYAFWQATLFGEDFETIAAGFDPQGDSGQSWSLAERFVYGLGFEAIIPALGGGVPLGTLVAAPFDNDTLRLLFWQSEASLYAPVEVLFSSELHSEAQWTVISEGILENIGVDDANDRVLRALSVPAPAEVARGFYRLRFQIGP